VIKVQMIVVILHSSS